MPQLIHDKSLLLRASFSQITDSSIEQMTPFLWYVLGDYTVEYRCKEIYRRWPSFVNIGSLGITVMFEFESLKI